MLRDIRPKAPSLVLGFLIAFGCSSFPQAEIAMLTSSSKCLSTKPRVIKPFPHNFEQVERGLEMGRALGTIAPYSWIDFTPWDAVVIVTPKFVGISDEVVTEAHSKACRSKWARYVIAFGAVSAAPNILQTYSIVVDSPHLHEQVFGKQLSLCVTAMGRLVDPGRFRNEILVSKIERKAGAIAVTIQLKDISHKVRDGTWRFFRGPQWRPLVLIPLGKLPLGHYSVSIEWFKDPPAPGGRSQLVLRQQCLFRVR